MSLTDAQARAIALDYRNARAMLETARDALAAAERTLAAAIMDEPGRVLVVAGWRLSSTDGEHVTATRERVVT